MNCKSYSSGGAARKEDKLVRALTAMDKKLDRKKKRRFAPIGDSRSLNYLREIERYLSWRYGSVLPDDDAGNDDLRMLVAAAKAAGKPAIDFVRKWAPRLPATDARQLCANVDFREAYISADERARRLGVTYAIHQMLHLREIGSIDVDKAGREKFRRARYNAKRRLKAAEKPPKPALSPREKALIKMVRAGRNMGDLQRSAGRSKLFAGLERESVERVVRRLAAGLVESGHLGWRLEPRERGGTEYYLWPEKPKTEETATEGSNLEIVRRAVPIFMGSNRRTKPCVIPPEGGIETHDRDGLKFGRGAVGDWDESSEPAPSAFAAGRYQPAGPETEMEQRI